MKLIALAAVAAFLVAAPLAAAQPIEGRWITQDGDAVVTVAPCGRSLCGTISRFLVTPPEGAGQRDVNNPDARLRTRRILGLPVLTDFSPDGDVWRGRIYDPKSGRTYRSVLERRDARTLAVKGCIGPICRTQLWRQAR
ncbi:DUF2147 domain-containing protein [Porphyrobacter sp. GA68]|uniref:DUF2147 domain-containing protein n=1 Tax=Porphyrobacter sp. GA68 TaxID=2883480 RepID=UPI001D189EA9|nr:DUF2147 domain-containing protein [Porphyrobacter sp. GA68]